MKKENLTIFNNILFSTIFTITAFLIGLFLTPQIVLADADVCFKYTNCSDCINQGKSYGCLWLESNKICNSPEFLRQYNYNISLYSSSCDGHTPVSAPTTPPASQQTTSAFQQTSSINCQSIASCKACLSNEECGWCYNECVTWIGSSSSCQLHSIPSADQCPENQAAPITVPTVRGLPTLTSALVFKKADGQSCKTSFDCSSGNCTNYVCCLKNKTCCSQSNFCSKDQYCSIKNNRYYCVPRLENGIICISSDQCQSNNCRKGICCGGQPCCAKDIDCKKDEYCETKDNLYYCRVKWNIGERCEKAAACRSGYCDTYTQKCTEDPKKITPTPKKTICGDKSCDDWLGENCCNCPGDCKSISDFCCNQNSQYANTRDRQNKIFYLYKPSGDSIPNGRLVVPKETDEKTFFNSYKPQICSNGKIINGECISSDQCVKGICVDNKCTAATSNNPQAVTDKKVAEAIYSEQTEYSKEDVWVNVYDVIKGTVLNSTRVEGNLEISLEVQGTTAGKIPEVKVGSKVESRLKITNNTSYSMAVMAGIVYPGKLANSFRLEEKKYTLSCSRINDNSLLTTIIGSSNAKRLGGQYFILPSNHQLMILSSIIPEQEGYLDVSGIVYYSKEKMYTNSSLVQVNIAPVNFETSFQKSKELSNSISVTKKKCSWLFCL